MLTTISEILFFDFNDDGNKLYVTEQALDLFKNIQTYIMPNATF